jgi:hypothetical protein
MDGDGWVADNGREEYFGKIRRAERWRRKKDDISRENLISHP